MKTHQGTESAASVSVSLCAPYLGPGVLILSGSCIIIGFSEFWGEALLK